MSMRKLRIEKGMVKVKKKALHVRRHDRAER
jgi:hypothetical protein